VNVVRIYHNQLVRSKIHVVGIAQHSVMMLMIAFLWINQLVKMLNINLAASGHLVMEIIVVYRNLFA
jgi:hypothetical protein